MRIEDQTKWRLKRNEDNEYSIQGKRGVINQCPDGDLDVWIKNTRLAIRAERDGWKAKNHYDDGALFIRPFADLDKACAYIQAPKKRHLSPEVRERAVARLATMRLAIKKPAMERVSQA